MVYDHLLTLPDEVSAVSDQKYLCTDVANADRLRLV